MLLLFIAPFLAVSLLLLFKGGFGAFIDQAFIFNFKYYSRPQNSLSSSNLIHTIRTLGHWLNFGLLGLMAMGIYLMRFKERGLGLAILFSIALALYNISITGRFYGHYFLPLG